MDWWPDFRDFIRSAESQAYSKSTELDYEIG